jgi:hypothetical protein
MHVAIKRISTQDSTPSEPHDSKPDADSSGRGLGQQLNTGLGGAELPSGHAVFVQLIELGIRAILVLGNEEVNEDQSDEGGAGEEVR